jgi:hypothetical protein
MGRIEELVDVYARHIATPWQRTVAGAQRVIMIVYDKELERTLRARQQAFEHATREAGHTWFQVDLTDAFATWLAGDDYRDAYFESPDDLRLKLDGEFPDFVAARVRSVLLRSEVDESTVVAVFGVASLFGFTRIRHLLRLVEPDIRGRLLVFFPGQYEQSNYHLLDARDGWNYLAVPIMLQASGGVA